LDKPGGLRCQKAPGGYLFTRPDGQSFLLFFHGDEKATLYVGQGVVRQTPAELVPAEVLVTFDRTVADKLDASYDWIIAYPDRPITGGAGS